MSSKFRQNSYQLFYPYSQGINIFTIPIIIKLLPVPLLVWLYQLESFSIDSHLARHTHIRTKGPKDQKWIDYIMVYLKGPKKYLESFFRIASA